MTEAQVAAGRGDDANAERLFRDALDAPEATPGVKWVAHDGLAQLAATAKRPADAARHFEAALQTVEQTRSALLKADYRISFTSRLIEFYNRYVDLLLAEGQVERALEVADSSRGRVLAERQNVAAAPARTSAAGLKQLARQTRTTLLFYWLGPTQSWVWTVTGDGITATPLTPRAELETLVAAHQSAIQNALADPLAAANSAGDALYQQLIQPVAAAVARGTSVVIVPDGALHRLNFETLPVPGTPQALLDRGRHGADCAVAGHAAAGVAPKPRWKRTGGAKQGPRSCSWATPRRVRRSFPRSATPPPRWAV